MGRSEISLNRRVMFLLMNIFRMFAAADRMDCDTLELTLLQFRILMLIKNEEGISMGEIAKFLFVNPAAISPQIDNLVALEWVERYHDKSDRRIIRVRLTIEKKQQLKRDFKKRAEHFNDLLSQLSDKEINDLVKTLGKLEKSIENHISP